MNFLNRIEYLMYKTITMRITPRQFIPCLSVFLLLGSCKQEKYPGPKSVDDEIASFVIDDNFEVKPVAVEPLVSMPVSMAVDENGRTFVVELKDYPVNQDPSVGAKGTPNGKSTIKELVDLNDDGVFDTAYLFASHITDMTSILPYKGGLLLAAAPNILYLKDTDDDHVADVIDTLYSGFFIGNSEAQITNFTYGIDNWIYANNTGQRGEVYQPENPDKKLSMGGHDFRFRMDTRQFEAESGTGQFGLAIDDWNNRYYAQNSDPVLHNPIAWRYLARHDFMPSYYSDLDIRDYNDSMYQTSATPYWRQERTNRRQRQYDSLNNGRTEYARGRFTGASGVTFYGGDAFPKEYYGSLFIGEVAGNLVHRSVLSYPQDKITMVASRAPKEQESEFLTTTDMWTRPCNFYSGPDGNLYLIDIYRQHIETPVSIPEDLQADMDFDQGNDHGRIYSIVPKGKSLKHEKPQLGKASAAELVAYLAHPNNWYRTTAQRLLVERQDKAAVPELRKLLNSSPDGRFRLRALYTLDGLGELTQDDVAVALRDTEAGVRTNALVLAEKFPSLRSAIVAALDDATAKVAFQAVLSIGNAPASDAIPALAAAFNKHAADSLYNVAVLSSLPGSSLNFLNALKSTSYFDNTDNNKLRFAKMVGYVFAYRSNGADQENILKFFEEKAPAEEWKAAMLKGFYDGLDSRKKPELSPAAKTILTGWEAAAGKDSQKVIKDLLKL